MAGCLSEDELLELAKAAACEPSVVAESAFALARSLSALGKDRSRAHELAGRARDTFAGIGKRAAKERAEVESWLRTKGTR